MQHDLRIAGVFPKSVASVYATNLHSMCQRRLQVPRQLIFQSLQRSDNQ
jgi:hypothetical protein